MCLDIINCFLEGFKDSCFENIVISTERCPLQGLFFSTKRSAKNNFLGINEILSITKSKILGC